MTPNNNVCPRLHDGSISDANRECDRVAGNNVESYDNEDENVNVFSFPAGDQYNGRYLKENVVDNFEYFDGGFQQFPAPDNAVDNKIRYSSHSPLSSNFVYKSPVTEQKDESIGSHSTNILNVNESVSIIENESMVNNHVKSSTTNNTIESEISLHKQSVNSNNTLTRENLLNHNSEDDVVLLSHETEELLRAERNEALHYTTDLKKAVVDLTRVETEAYRELEVERACLEAELSDVEGEISSLEKILNQLQQRKAAMELRHDKEAAEDTAAVNGSKVRLAKHNSDLLGEPGDREIQEQLELETRRYEDLEFAAQESSVTREMERDDLNESVASEGDRLAQQKSRQRQLKQQESNLTQAIKRECDKVETRRNELDVQLTRERQRSRLAERKLLKIIELKDASNTSNGTGLTPHNMTRGSISPNASSRSSSPSPPPSPASTSRLHLLHDVISERASFIGWFILVTEFCCF